MPNDFDNLTTEDFAHINFTDARRIQTLIAAIGIAVMPASGPERTARAEELTQSLQKLRLAIQDGHLDEILTLREYQRASVTDMLEMLEKQVDRLRDDPPPPLHLVYQSDDS